MKILSLKVPLNPLGYGYLPSNPWTQTKQVGTKTIYVIFFAGTPQQREGYSVSLNIFENSAYQKIT